MRRHFILFVLLVVHWVFWSDLPARGEALATNQAATQEPLVILVNSANNIDNLTIEELRKIFQGQRSHWPNGRKITLVVREAGNPEHETALRQIFRMSESEYERHFLHSTFTGEMAAPPKQLATAAGVKKFIFHVPGAVGYVRASEVDNTVKVVPINGHNPKDRDYPLRLIPR